MEKERGEVFEKERNSESVRLLFNDLGTTRSEVAPKREGNELFFIPPPEPINDEEINAYFSRCINVFDKSVCITRNVDIIDRALAELQIANYDYEVAFGVMKNLRWANLGISVWSEAEVAAFEAGIALSGHDLEYTRKTVCHLN
jgi:hypothetical protein